MSMAAPQILQATAWYPPYHMGGTETYVAQLVEGLKREGFDTRVVTPQSPNAPQQYEYAGTAVLTYPVGMDVSRRAMRERDTHDGFAAFEALLSANEGAVYHQHSWTRGCGRSHLAAAKARGFATVLTMHLPHVICLRESMLLNGQSQCDGLVKPVRCGACWLKSKGLAAPLTTAIASLPRTLTQAARHSALLGPVGTAIGSRTLAEERQDDVQSMCRNADIVVAVCQWMYDALCLNGVPENKVRLVRQGVDAALSHQLSQQTARPAREGGPLRLLFLGRITPLKGVVTLVRSIIALPEDCDVQLTIHGIEDPDNPAYMRQVSALAAQDKRITLAPPVPSSELAETLLNFDVLAAPSRWLETGPLVVLEAQAAGLYIIGTDRGGIAELVKEPEQGLLVPADDLAAWGQAIQAVAERKATRSLPRPGGRLRTSHDVARDMAALYREVRS